MRSWECVSAKHDVEHKTRDEHALNLRQPKALYLHMGKCNLIRMCVCVCAHALIPHTHTRATQ